MKLQSLLKPASLLLFGALLAISGYLFLAITDPLLANFSSPLWLPSHLLIIFGGIFVAIGLSGKLSDALRAGEIFSAFIYFLFITGILLFEIGARSIVAFAKPYLSVLSTTIKPPMSNLLFVGSYWILPLALFSLGVIRLRKFGTNNLLGWLLMISAASFLLPGVALFNVAVSVLPMLLMSFSLLLLAMEPEDPSRA